MSRPDLHSFAVLIVDMQKAFVDKHRPTITASVAASQGLVELARAHGLPVLYSVQVAPGGPFEAKLPALARLHPGSVHCELAAELEGAPEADVYEKTAPSFFHGTDLAEELTARGVSSVLIAGTSISGCVRATAIDAMSHGFYPTVVVDASYDPQAESAQQTLADIEYKYGALVNLRDVPELIELSSKVETK